MNVAHLPLVFVLWSLVALVLSSDVSGMAAACQVIMDPCSSDTLLNNRTSQSYIRDGHPPKHEQRCSDAPSPSDDVPPDQRATPDLAEDDTYIPWPPHRDGAVCQTLSAMLVVPRAHHPRPSSAVISAPPDTNTSHLVSVLRSCSLWELVSLFSAFAWLFVCLAS
ncbi:hypothetical protein OH77DRAFT_1422262 [Trametes cingulata]|nr:hypothetical protein OH77DRAFT_1422262 [Trametes cingulata]